MAAHHSHSTPRTPPAASSRAVTVVSSPCTQPRTCILPPLAGLSPPPPLPLPTSRHASLPPPPRASVMQRGAHKPNQMPKPHPRHSAHAPLPPRLPLPTQSAARPNVCGSKARGRPTRPRRVECRVASCWLHDPRSPQAPQSTSCAVRRPRSPQAVQSARHKLQSARHARRKQLQSAARAHLSSCGLTYRAQCRESSWPLA